jgi:DNA-binding NarL/FixJ family response regulator
MSATRTRGRSATRERPPAQKSEALALVAPPGQAQVIASALGSDCGLLVRCFDSPTDALADEEERFCAVLLCSDERGSSLVRSLEPLKRHFEDAPILVACREIERWEVRSLLAAGAAGIVLERDLAHALVPCLRAAQAGQVCVPRRHSRQVEPPALSTREKQILGLVVMGYMNSQIADRLFLAESTVKSHLSSAFGKLGVRSRNEAVKLIVSPDSGLGLGILGLGGEPLEPAAAVTP